MRRILAIVVCIAVPGTILEASAREPAEIGPPSHRPIDRVEVGTPPYVIGAAGDIACASGPNGPDRPRSCQHDDTSDLIVEGNLDEVLTLGDNQYDTGAFADFMDSFHPTWGRAFSNLSPTPGNHEYGNDPSSTPRGYFRYFGARARGPDGLGYYSFDLGACPEAPCWHLIALNSELCFAAGGCGPAADPLDPGPGNRMHDWLEQDLASHPDSEYPCTLAYWHHPLFSFSSGSGATGAVRPLWLLLDDADADVVLTSHSHNYQRWRPQDLVGNRDRAGMRQFIVGTGGASHYSLQPGTWPENLVAAQARAFGILRIALKAEGYRWAWVGAAGQPGFDDASERLVRCVRGS
jgi:acid phosphatase type 7